MNRKLIFRSLMIVLIFVGLASCDDEPLSDDLSSENPGATTSFQVDIDGETFHADLSGMLTENGVTRIIGSKSNGTKVSLTVAGSGVGIFTLDGSSQGKALYIIAGQEEPYTMENVDTIGVLTISKYDALDSLASGTFSFRASRTVVVDTTITDSTGTGTDSTTTQTSEILNFTNGVFNNISLQTDEFVPPDSSQSDFHVTLDDVLYNGNNVQGAILPDQGLVIGTSNDVQQFVLQVFNPEEGSFNLSTENDEGLIIYNTDSTDSESPVYTATEGMITISNLDQLNQTVSGTFTGTLTSANSSSNTIAMNNGVFHNIPYVTEVANADSMVANIGGQDFNASDIITAGVDVGSIGIIGTDQLDDQLQFNVPQNVMPGTYPISQSGNFHAIYTKEDPDSGDSTVYNSLNNTGNITIEARDGDVISGSFSFSVRNAAGEVLQVTDGHFSVDIGL